METWFWRLRQSDWLPVFKGISIYVFGLVGGKILETAFTPLFANEFRAILSTLFVVGLLAVSTLIATSVFAHRTERREQMWRGTVDNLRRQIGLSVEFIYDPPPGTGEAYRRAKEIVEQAKESILVLTWNLERDPAERLRREELWSREYKQEREEYARALIQQAEKNADNPYFYKRIHQFQDGEPHFDLAHMNAWIINHTKELLKRQNSKKKGTVLKIGKPFFPYTYVVVDKHYAILAIDGYDYKTKSQGMDGVLIFHDPHQAFVGHLVSFFEQLDEFGSKPPENTLQE